MLWEQTLIPVQYLQCRTTKKQTRSRMRTFDMMIGNIIDDQEVQNQVGYERYDIVAANILADVLVPLTPVIVHQMKKGAYYITSGILDVKEESGKSSRTGSRAYSLVEVTHQGEWVCCNSKKGLKLLMQQIFCRTLSD